MQASYTKTNEIRGISSSYWYDHVFVSVVKDCVMIMLFKTSAINLQLGAGGWEKSLMASDFVGMLLCVECILSS